MNKNIKAHELIKHRKTSLKLEEAIKWYNEADLEYIPDNDNTFAQKQLDQDILNNLWFYNFHVPNSPIGTRDAGKNILYLLRDFFFQYHHFAIREAKILKLADKVTVSDIIYKIGLRTGEPLSIDSDEYWALCKAFYNSMAIENESEKAKGKLMRPVFPAIGNYPAIEVYDIPNRWRSGSKSSIEKDSIDNKLSLRGFIGKFDSWIISPLNAAELHELSIKYKEIMEKGKLATKLIDEVKLDKKPTSEGTSDEKAMSDREISNKLNVVLVKLDEKEKELDRVINCYLEQTSRLLFRYVLRNSCIRGGAAFCAPKGGKDEDALKDAYKKWLKDLLRKIFS
jgi:hypothetical protein